MLEDGLMVTHVITSGGALLHVLGTRAEVEASLEAAMQVEPPQLWRVEVATGIGKIEKLALVWQNVEMVENDHPFKVAASMPFPAGGEGDAVTSIG